MWPHSTWFSRLRDLQNNECLRRTRFPFFTWWESCLSPGERFTLPSARRGRKSKRAVTRADDPFELPCPWVENRVLLETECLAMLHGSPCSSALTWTLAAVTRMLRRLTAVPSPGPTQAGWLRARKEACRTAKGQQRGRPGDLVSQPWPRGTRWEPASGVIP